MTIWSALFLCFLAIGCYPEQPTAAVTDPGDLSLSALLAPSSFSIIAADTSLIGFRWTDESIGETGFSLEMSVNNGPFSTVAGFPANTLTGGLQWPLSRDSVYAFRLRAIRLEGTSGPSSVSRLMYDEEYFLTKEHRINGLRWDGVFRLKDGTSELILQSTSINTQQYSDIIFRGDSLVITGPFTSVDGRPANRVAFWNGTEWQAFGNGIDHLSPLTLIPLTNDLFLGTIRYAFAPQPLYRYQADRFQAVSMPVYADAGAVIDGVEFNNMLIAELDYGYLDDGHRTPEFFLAYSAGSPVPFPQPADPDLREYAASAMTVHKGDIYVSLRRTVNTGSHPADTTLLRYDGSSWHVMHVRPPRGFVHSMHSWGQELFAVNMVFDSIGAFLGSEAVRWTGSAWTLAKNTTDPVFGLWHTPNGMIAGRLEQPDNVSVLEKWDGSTWTELARYSDGYSPRKVVARSAWTWINQ